MKLIAHRGASLEYPESSLTGLAFASELGAYAVECDVQTTRDQVLIIHHDPDLQRLAGVPDRVADTDYPVIKALLERAGRRLLTLAELLQTYEGQAPLLLHLKMPSLSPALLQLIRQYRSRLICGVVSLDALAGLADILPASQILAFMGQPEEHAAYVVNGAGIIRIWEHWLGVLTPAEVKRQSGVKVWIMANDGSSMDGSAALLDRAVILGADGVLLNNIRLAVAWQAGR